MTKPSRRIIRAFATTGQMRGPDPQPWHALSFVPLNHFAIAYAAAGAEIWNTPEIAPNPDEARKVDRQGLINILMDHSWMLEALRKDSRVGVENGD